MDVRTNHASILLCLTMGSNNLHGSKLGMKVEAILTFLVGVTFVYSLIFWTAILAYKVSQPTGQLSVFRDEIQKDVRVMYDTMSKEVATIFSAVDAFSTSNPKQIASPRFLRSPLQAMTSIEQQLLAQQLYR
jgi:hypothetical protein